MSLIDWILLGAVILQALIIPLVHLNGFKSGMLIQYENKNNLPPIIPASTFGPTTVNGNGKEYPVQEDPHYTDVL